MVRHSKKLEQFYKVLESLFEMDYPNEATANVRNNEIIYLMAKI